MAGDLPLDLGPRCADRSSSLAGGRSVCLCAAVVGYHAGAGDFDDPPAGTEAYRQVVQMTAAKAVNF